MMKVDYLVYAIGGIISYLNVTLIFCKINNLKYKFNIIHLFILLVMGILNAYITIHFPIAFKPIYNLLCLYVSINFASKRSFKETIYYVSLIWFTGIILDIFFMALFSVFFNYILKIWPKWGMLFISLFLQLILNIIFRFKNINLLVIKFKNKITLVKNIVWIFILTIFTVILFGIFAFKNKNSLSYVTIFIFLLLLSISFIVFLIKILIEEKTYKITIDNLLNNNSYYLDLNTKDRLLKHNLIHNLNSIKSVSDKKANVLIDDLIKDINNNSITKDLDNLPNGINGLICKTIYLRKNKPLNIAVNNYLKSDLFEVLSPRRYNKLCEAIGVCLDNAVTASEQSKEKILQVVLSEDDSTIRIKIINTFKTSLEVDKLGTINYTTKNSGNGLGLYSLLGKRDIKIKTSIINSLFENLIIVKKIK